MRLPVVFAVLMGIAPGLVEAKNPTILIKDPPPPAVIITGDTFGFSANTSGGGVFAFQNASGSDWASLTVTAILSRLTPITCGPGPFLTCTVSTAPVSGGFMYDILFGPAANDGIKNGAVFTVSLNDEDNGDPNGVGSWAPGRDFDGKATFAPEPASLLLMLAGGMLGLGALRMRRGGIVS